MRSAHRWNRPYSAQRLADLWAAVAVLLALSSAQAQIAIVPRVEPARPISLADTVNFSVNEGLGYVLRGEVPQSLGTQLILRAGATDNPDSEPLLQEIIAAWAARNTGLDFNYETQTAAALHVLWHQGKEQEYFVELVRAWPQNYTLAVHAANILARTATPEVLALLEEVHTAAIDLRRSDYMGGALSHAKFVAYRMEQYEALPTAEARAEMVLGRVSIPWSLVSHAHFERVSTSGWMDVNYSDPYSVVAWGWFLSLSDEAPGAVARAIEEAVDEYMRETGSRWYPSESQPGVRNEIMNAYRELSRPAVRALLPEPPAARQPEEP